MSAQDTSPERKCGAALAFPSPELDEDGKPVVLDFVALRQLELTPIPCRLVAGDRQVVWQSSRLTQLLQRHASGGCCESLGLRHSEADCPSSRTIREIRMQRRTLWLGRLHVAVETLPVTGVDGDDVASLEFFRDVTPERKLEGALIRQQELLETINRSMIEINHHLEAAQTELEAKNRSLETVNEQLRSLDQMKDDFLSIVSHELKAPLTSIKASVRLISGREAAQLTPTGAELLQVCHRSTDRLHRMVEDLLDVTRIESGRMSLDFSRFDVSDMIIECLHSVQALADGKGLELECLVDPALQITADRDRLIQVIVNLVNNAIKFTDRGGVTIRAASEPDRMTFSVEDTGIGIPEPALSTIFDKFTQVGSSLRRNAGGTGLGLAIARGIAREHGGDIRVNSRPGEGSCFTFYVPQPPGKNCNAATGPLD